MKGNKTEPQIQKHIFQRKGQQIKNCIVQSLLILIANQFCGKASVKIIWKKQLLQLFCCNQIIYLKFMHLDPQNRYRQSKKKIFGEQNSKSKLEDKSCSDAHSVRQSIITENDNGKVIDDMKRQIQQLNINVQTLKHLLKQQRERYDGLFEEYEELMEKNSLIEKEYINLKYQHNKEMKHFKQNISEKIAEQVEKMIHDFSHSLKEDHISSETKIKIQKFYERLQSLSKITNLQKFKRKNSQKLIEISPQKQRYIEIQEKEYLQLKKSNYEQIDTLPLLEKRDQTQAKEVSYSIDSIQIGIKQVVFQDQYYGEIEDFTQYEQKIIQRRNYELMKKNRSSNDIKRKKIFNPVSSFV